MQSRMDKYNEVASVGESRTQRNKTLYEDVRNSALTDFDVNSNVSIIDDNADHINVNKIRKMLDERYNAEAPKRRSIELPTFEEPVIEEQFVDTKEYDINAILEKAKKGKNVDYNKERLKKIREAQYEILNNLDLELKKVEDIQQKEKNKEAEDNLLNLIQTITDLELKNKKGMVSRETSQAIDLLSDLQDDATKVEREIEEATKKEQTISSDGEIQEGKNDLNKIEKKDDMETKKEEKSEDHVEQTLSKLNIDLSSYDDFSDISKRDNGMIVIKIVVFLIVIALVIGAVYILDHVLSLGLF